MPSLVLLLWFTLCAEQDIRQRRIADKLTVGAGVLALVCLFATGHTWIGSSMVEAAAALVLSMAGANRAGQLIQNSVSTNPASRNGVSGSTVADSGFRSSTLRR